MTKPLTDSVRSRSPWDTVKLVLSALLVGGGLFGFYFFESHLLLYRVVGLLVLVVLAAVLFLNTRAGREFWRFGREARVEVRKIIWPTRQETVQTTIVVVAAVFLTGIFVWILDYALFQILRRVMG